MEDHEYESLSALLRTVDPPPTSVSLDAILDAGRQSARRRRVVATAAAASGIAIVLFGAVGAVALTRHASHTPENAASSTASAKSTPTASQTAVPTGPDQDVAQCTPQILPAPHGETVGLVNAADPSGRYIAGLTLTNKLIVWKDGVPTVYTPPKGIDIQPGASAINSHGEVVGAVPDGSHSSAWTELNGTFKKLRAPSGFPIIAQWLGINSHGDIAGTVAAASGNAEAAVVWPADHPGSVRMLKGPAHTTYGPEAQAIDDDGTVVGTIDDGDYAFVWDPSGKGHRLANPPGYAKANAKAFAVSGDWVVGYVAPDATTLAARWNLKTGKAEVFPDFTQATSVNSSGDFVGGSGSGLGLGNTDDAYLGRGTTVLPLPVPPQVELSAAFSISADGKTVGGATQEHVGQSPSVPGMYPNATIWHC
ncbi:MAG TPA: hypothetical protein VFR11_12120 [Micromonosporaceae bacterium]|jgi:uncharacterized membrane protein|nr:hypothetical protein [Micromonosporaceae bacterium]